MDLISFDQSKAARTIKFFENILKHTKGAVAGHAFKLMLWQLEIFTEVFGTLDADTGTRLYQTIYLEIAKKNAKSEMAAGIGLYCLLADHEAAAEVYGAASSKKQAGLVFDAAAAMVDMSSVLKKKLHVIPSTKRIVKLTDRYSFYEAISADGNKADGVNPSCSIFDELHRWRGEKCRQLFGVLSQSSITRQQPIRVMITTAGESPAKCPIAWEQHEYCRRVNAGLIKDRRFFGRIYAAEPKDEIDKPATWAKANPSLDINGGYLASSVLADMAQKAANDPAARIDFKRYHLNLWNQTKEKWVTPEEWALGNVEPRRLVDRPCYAGLDLSSTTDLTALVLVFPSLDTDFDPEANPEENGESYDVLPHFWMPKDNVAKFSDLHGVNYQEWIDAGLISTTHGNTVDFNPVKKKLEDARELFELREVGFDPWNAHQFANDLTDDGFRMVPLRQGYATLSEPTKRVHKLILRGKIRHDGNPVLAWNADCVEIKTDGDGNCKPIKPERGKSNIRIDGIVALVMAFARVPIQVREDKSIFGSRETSVI